MIGIIAIAVVVGVAANRVKKMGVLTPQSAQQRLGDVPLYKNGTIDETATKWANGTASFFSGLMKKNGGGDMLIVAVRTNDTPEQIFKFYDKALVRKHWAQVGTTGMGIIVQHDYRRGQDVATVQVQDSMGMRVVTVTRLHLPRSEGSNSAPSPSNPNLQPAQ